MSTLDGERSGVDFVDDAFAPCSSPRDACPALSSLKNPTDRQMPGHSVRAQIIPACQGLAPLLLSGKAVQFTPQRVQRHEPHDPIHDSSLAEKDKGRGALYLVLHGGA